MEALDGALVNVSSLSVVSIPLIQFGCNARCKFWGIGTPILGEQPTLFASTCSFFGKTVSV